MKRLFSLAMTLCVLGSATTALADGPAFFGRRQSLKPLPLRSGQFVVANAAENIYAPPPAPGVGGKIQPMPAGKTGGGKGALFPCVVYEDLDNVHPCAVSKIVCIVDPCWKPDPCSCCKPQKPRCVQVKICVPPCCRPRVKVSKDGRKVTYDYGKYEVELKSKKGKVYVDYDD
ncbi:MAG: hypothetical protein IID45_12995 [Planctomycetes bacterium]|nr:hypothetical protein [Planctomycetota bacterium]